MGITELDAEGDARQKTELCSQEAYWRGVRERDR
jgi:hypothetical protein